MNGSPINYSLDLAAGLTQVLSDGTNAYLYGPDLMTGQGYRIGEEQPGGWLYHLPDPLMSSRQLADAGAEVALSRSCQPFGTLLASSGNGVSTFRFTGEQSDGTGLVYLRARYYDAGTGRFLAADPSRSEANPYGYSQGNPLRYVDPSGLFGVCSF